MLYQLYHAQLHAQVCLRCQIPKPQACKYVCFNCIPIAKITFGVKSNRSVVSLSETSTNNGLASALFAPIHLMIFHHLPTPILLHVIFCQCAIDSPYGSRAHSYVISGAYQAYRQGSM